MNEFLQMSVRYRLELPWYKLYRQVPLIGTKYKNFEKTFHRNGVATKYLRNI